MKKIFYFFLLFILVISIYGIYLYIKINHMFGGKVWKFPISIYSRIITLEPDNFYSKHEMIAILKSNRYKQVNILAMPGEFVEKKHSLILFRRSFNFPEGFEHQVKVKLLFNKNKLSRIIHLSNNRDFSILRLDPQLISMIQSPEGKKRLFLSRNNFPKILIQSLLAIEDKYFYDHDGINLCSMIRALLVNITFGHIIQGGSTLTQQLVKNLFLTNTRSLWRKFNELYMALILDWKYSKEQILELYLNEVYLGQDGNEQIRGFPLASLYYFGRPINELRLDEYALLVGMMKGSSLYNPWTHPIAAYNRRNLVLRSLFHQNVINDKIYKKLQKKCLNIQSKGSIIWFQSSFIQVLKEEIQSKVGNYILNLSGIKIFTTLDIRSQISIENSVEIVIDKLKKKKKLQDWEVSIISVDRFSGEIRGLLSRSNLNLSTGYNRVIQTKRSIGSLFIPVMYLDILSHPEKFGLNIWTLNKLINIKIKDGELWKFKNNHFLFENKVILVDALTHFINTPMVNFSIWLRFEKIIKDWIKLGLLSNHVSKISSIFSDTIHLTPTEVAEVFQVISSGGKKSDISSIRSILSEDNKLLYYSFPQSKQVESTQASHLVLYAMQSVVKSGIAQELGKHFKNKHLAGKISIANNFSDNWFVGVDGNQLVVIWIGRNNSLSTRFFGISGVMDIYRHYLQLYNPQPLIL